MELINKIIEKINQFSFTESIFDILTSQYVLVPIAFLILRKIWRLFIRGTGF
jgi:hypothetical protein